MGWDIGNTAFEAVGAVLSWNNVRMLRRDRVVKGVDWRVTAFWTAWGLWNLAYYPALGQAYSAAAGAVLATANAVWVGHALYYIRRQRRVNADYARMMGWVSETTPKVNVWEKDQASRN